MRGPVGDVGFERVRLHVAYVEHFDGPVKRNIGHLSIISTQAQNFVLTALSKYPTVSPSRRQHVDAWIRERDGMDLKTLKSAIALPECAGGTDAAARSQWAKKVIVRSRDAGYLPRHICRKRRRTIHLRDARQLWKWHAAKGSAWLMSPGLRR